MYPIHTDSRNTASAVSVRIDHLALMMTGRTERRYNMKHNYVVIGATWRDSVNGNTYCNAKMIRACEGFNGNEYSCQKYIGFQYGYGNHYFDQAVKYIESTDPDHGEIINGGCFEVGKRDLRNNRF